MKGVLLDNNFNPIIEHGRMKIGDRTQQDQKLLLISQKGDFREFPHLGIGIQDYIDTDQVGELRALIRQQYELCGLRIEHLKIETVGGNITGRLDIQATY